MASADVIGNDVSITVAAQSGNFQLNVMLPVMIAYNLLKSINLLSGAMNVLSKNTISSFKVNKKNLEVSINSSGSVIPLFRKQIAQGGPVTITAKNVTRYFMTIFEASSLVIQAGEYANGGDVFILDMGDQVKIIDLAEKLIYLSGRNMS